MGYHLTTVRMAHFKNIGKNLCWWKDGKPRDSFPLLVNMLYDSTIMENSMESSQKTQT